MGKIRKFEMTVNFWDNSAICFARYATFSRFWNAASLAVLMGLKYPGVKMCMRVHALQIPAMTEYLLY